jgi:hypothetical protein
VARSSAGRRTPAAQQGSLRAPQYAGGGTGSWRPRVDCGGTRRNRPGSLTPQRFLLRQSLRRVLAAIVSAAVRGPVASARDDPRRPAAVSARPQHRQLPSRTPGMTCRHSRPESRKGAERRAGIRNLCPFRIPVLPVRPSPAIRLLAGREGRGTLRPAIPLGQRNAVPRGRPLKAAGGEVRIPVRPCRKRHWMLEFLAAPTRPGTPGQAGSELSFQCRRPGAVPLAV